jgi:hypothetical protein
MAATETCRQFPIVGPTRRCGCSSEQAQRNAISKVGAKAQTSPLRAISPR